MIESASTPAALDAHYCLRVHCRMELLTLAEHDKRLQMGLKQ